MRASAGWRAARLCVAALAVLLGVGLAGRGQPDGCCLSLDRLQRMSPEQLHELFVHAEVGTPLTGPARGRLLCITDKVLPRVKVRLANSVWRGKAASPDGWFTNRWIGDRDAIASRYVIGPSWVDGRPAVLMEYEPGTPLFANMHDELREVAPGLYLGPVIERFPCPKFRGYIALQLEACADCRPGRCRCGGPKSAPPDP
jgi:hypothetical protein